MLNDNMTPFKEYIQIYYIIFLYFEIINNLYDIIYKLYLISNIENIFN